jgi:tetratricopeptide (TPR) repeat protein
VLSDRWLLPCALGACWMIAQLIEAAAARIERPALRGAIALGLCGLLAIQTLVAAEENASYRSENTRVLHLAGLYEQASERPRDADEVLLAAAAIRAEQSGDLEGAVRAHAGLAGRKPEDSVRHYNLAHALLQAGDLRAALDEAHIAFHGHSLDGSRRFPENDSRNRRRAEKALLLGLILERLGDRAAAVRYFEQTIELNPGVTLAQTHLRQLRSDVAGDSGKIDPGR